MVLILDDVVYKWKTQQYFICSIRPNNILFALSSEVFSEVYLNTE